MRVLSLSSLAGLGCLFLALPVLSEDNPGSPAAVDQLVARLGSGSFAEREEAGQALLAAGTPAMKPLRQAMRSDDPEIAHRASGLVAILEVRADTDRLLRGRRLHLVYKDTPLKDALADFNRKAGVNLVLASTMPSGQDGVLRVWNGTGKAITGVSKNATKAEAEPEKTKVKSFDEVRLGAEKITLDTGDVTFWEAYDQFCRAAGLADSALVPGPQQAAPDAPLQLSGVRFGVVRKVVAMRSLYVEAGGVSAEHPGQFPLTFARLPGLPTCYAGPVRVRVHPPGVAVGGEALLGERERMLGLEVTPEPGFAWQGILDVRITRALDSHGRSVFQSQPYIGGPGPAEAILSNVVIWDDSEGFVATRGHVPPWQVPLRLRLADDKITKLGELSGVVVARVTLPNEPLLVQDDILHAAGKTVQGPSGSSLKVLDVRREKDGTVVVKVDMHPLQADEAQSLGNIAGAARVRLNLPRRAILVDLDGDVTLKSDYKALALVDAEGKAFWPAEVKSAGSKAGDGAVLLFRPSAGQKAPSQLVYHGPREVVIEVPFTLKDVPLP